MSNRRRMMLAAFCAGWLAQLGPAAEPARLGLADGKPLPVAVSPNQQLADNIATNLRQSGQLRGYSVDLIVIGTTVEVSGVVANQPQREEVLRIIQGVPGVEKVVDRIRPVEPINPITRVQAGIGGNLPEPLPGTPRPVIGGSGGNFPVVPSPFPTPMPPIIGGGGSAIPVMPIPGTVIPGGPIIGGGGIAIPGTPLPLPGSGIGSAIPSSPVPGAVGDPSLGGRQEPTPIFQAPGMGYNSMNPPRMPPYAWPTYAPYNNYSRVAYPEAYPQNAFPFIGPIHPFPKIPLGWRSVKLEWDDGYWWFSRTASKHDWWRLRFY